MKLRTILLATVLTTTVAVTGAEAQRTRVIVQSRAWLGISYDPVFSNGQRPRLVIRDVVDDSPAERAGLMVGDTILRINDINATEEIMSSLGSALSAGDQVRVRVRRSGGEREVVVTATERPPQYATLQPDSRVIIVDPDSVRGRLHILMDSVRTRIDSLDLPGIYIERRGGIAPDLRYYMVPRDSFVFKLDSLGRRSFLFNDSVRMRIDTVWQRMLPRVHRFEFRGDSVFRWHADSVWRGFPGDRALRLDSTFRGFSEFEARGLPGFAGVLSVRAIAGAELTDLSEGLTEYFGADEGVLVLRVPPGTPASRSGLQEGDVIVRVNDRDVSNTAELRSAVARAGASQPVKLEIIRKRNRLTLDLKRE